jgi:hypothetical protein
MWHAMFVEQIPLAEKILRTVLVYALIALLFRVAGKRGLANLNTFDFVVIFLLSNVVQNAVIGNDTSLTGGVVGAVTLVAVNAVVTRVVASNARAARLFDGHATTVIRDGHVVGRALRHLGLRRSELDHAVRLQNGDDISEVQRGSLAPPRRPSPRSPRGSAGSSSCWGRPREPCPAPAAEPGAAGERCRGARRPGGPARRAGRARARAGERGAHRRHPRRAVGGPAVRPVRADHGAVDGVHR